LNTVVEFGVPLIYIFPEVSQPLNVKPIPGCASEDYAKRILELFDSGLITFSSEVPGDDTESRAGISRIVERFRASSRKPSFLRNPDNLPPGRRFPRVPGTRVSFKLTQLGGEALEKTAQPDWTHYFFSVDRFSRSWGSDRRVRAYFN
jgi:hypothetical protein